MAPTTLNLDERMVGFVLLAKVAFDLWRVEDITPSAAAATVRMGREVLHFRALERAFENCRAKKVRSKLCGSMV